MIRMGFTSVGRGPIDPFEQHTTGRTWRGKAILVTLVVIAIGALVIWHTSSIEVRLINGTDHDYVVDINGQSFELAAGESKDVDLSTGEMTVSVTGLEPAVEPTTITIDVPLVDMLLDRPAVVINPDRCAVIAMEQCGYYIGTPPDPDPKAKWELHAGQAHYQFDDIHYNWEQLPDEISMDRDKDVVIRRSINLWEGDTSTDTIELFAEQLDEESMLAHLRHRAFYAPDDGEYVATLIRWTPEDRVMPLLRELIAIRPINIESHRYYQEYAQRLEPDHDVLAEYRKLYGQSPGDSARQYLLGRLVTDAVESRKLFLAAAPNDQTGRALNALAWNHLVRGEASRAVGYIEQALAKQPDRKQYASLLIDALHADGQHKKMVRLYRKYYPNCDESVQDSADLIHAYVGMGDRDEVQNQVERYLAHLRANTDDEGRIAQHRAYLRCAVAGAQGDVEKYVASARELGTAYWNFIAAMMEHRLEDAATIAASEDYGGIFWTQHLLLSFEARRAGSAELERVHRRAAAEQLADGDTDERYLAAVLAGEIEPDLDRILGLSLTPDLKRTALAAVALTEWGAKQPAVAKLAERLNWDPEFPGVYLTQLFKDPMWPRP